MCMRDGGSPGGTFPLEGKSWKPTIAYTEVPGYQRFRPSFYRAWTSAWHTVGAWLFVERKKEGEIARKKNGNLKTILCNTVTFKSFVSGVGTSI